MDPAAAPELRVAAMNPTLHTTSKSSASQSVPGSTKTRRHSLPLHFLPPSLWSANTSSASLLESEAAALGEHILDEATIAHRISALRQLNGATRSRHRYAKSTGARNSTFSQPVIVRTYSGATRPRNTQQQRDIVAVKKENGPMAKRNMEVKLPPVEAFSFKGIMEEIRHGVSEDLERIAEICARSKYSLSNQYEVHMPPHGRGEFLQQVGGATTAVGGPTLQAIGSDDESVRHVERRRGGRRTKSAAYGTLETIMSSSRSSEEDQPSKKPAAVLAEEVRGRAAKKELAIAKKEPVEEVIETGPTPERSAKHVRSKPATFASMIIDSAQGFGNDAASYAVPVSLVSEPARPKTSNTDLETLPVLAGSDTYTSSSLHISTSPKPSMVRNASTASTLLAEAEQRSTILGSFSSWLPWSKSTVFGGGFQGRMRSASHAEGSLRDLLKATELDKKGKGVDRTG